MMAWPGCSISAFSARSSPRASSDRGATGLADTARALAVWTIVILVLVIGYQYRYELQDIASRLTGGLI